jgi:hypothetical protein
MSPAKNNLNKPTQEESSTGRSVLPAEAENQLKNDAGALADTAKQEFSAVTEEVQAQAGAAVDAAKSEIGKVAEKAKGMAAEQKEFVAGQIESVAEAVNKVAAELESSDASSAGYARTLADTVTSFSETVKTKNVDELLAMAQDFGRRQPVVFMSAAALMGFAASRFLTSSSHRQQTATSSSPEKSGTMPGESYRGAENATRDTMGGGL